MNWLAKFIGSTALSGLNMLLGTGGKIITDIHADNTTRQRNENDAGNQLAGTIANASNAAGGQRADVQKSQGAWGPFGLAGFIIAMAFAFHVVMVVLDSSSWHLVPVFKFHIVPWLEWQPHVINSWKIAALPGKFEDTEHEILKALFYVGPSSAALVIASKAFSTMTGDAVTWASLAVAIGLDPGILDALLRPHHQGRVKGRRCRKGGTCGLDPRAGTAG
ncbi:hypothetical protein [Bradyrhizobium sp. URHC0002]